MDIKTITKLREQTGAGMMDCKKALVEANEDFDKAVEILRKKGEAKAAKKSDRETSEGVIAMANNENKIAIVALACETDFVSRNEDFVNSANYFAQELLNKTEEEFKTWADEKIKNELVVKIGENIQLLDYKTFSVSGKTFGQYIHSNNKIGAVVLLDQGNEEIAKDVAMHVTAMAPEFARPEDVPAENINKEKEIYKEQLKEENKPADIIDKIIEGKLNKYYQDICLVKQIFIKDDKKNIEKVLEEAGAKLVDFYLVRI